MNNIALPLLPVASYSITKDRPSEDRYDDVDFVAQALVILRC